MKKSLIKLKGEHFAKSVVISSLFDFQKYYYSILSNDLREKIEFQPIMSMDKIITDIYSTFTNSPLYESPEDQFWFLVNHLRNGNQRDKRKIKLKISGGVYRIVKHFRGIPDDVIIEFGDMVPLVNSDEILQKVKKKIATVINLIYEVIVRQMSEMSNKIFAYGHIYYGAKIKQLQFKDFMDNDIYYDFVELK